MRERERERESAVKSLSSLSPSVSYSEPVPEGGPPSFNGRLVKYTYKLAVGAQKPGCPAQIARIPFHVRTIPGRNLSERWLHRRTSL